MKLLVAAATTTLALATTVVNAAPTVYVLGDSLSDVGLLSAADDKGANGLWREALGIPDAGYTPPDLFWQASFTSSPGPWTAQVNGTTIGDGAVTVKSFAYGGARLLETFDSTDLCLQLGLAPAANCTTEVPGLQGQADMLLANYKDEINVDEDLVVFQFGINDIIKLLFVLQVPIYDETNTTIMDNFALNMGGLMATQLAATREALQTELPGLRVVIADIPTLQMPLFNLFGPYNRTAPAIAATINNAVLKSTFPNNGEVWSFSTALANSMDMLQTDRNGALITEQGCAIAPCFSIFCPSTCLTQDNAEDYFYVDVVHPVGAAHTYVKDDFTNFVNVNGLITASPSASPTTTTTTTTASPTATPEVEEKEKEDNTTTIIVVSSCIAVCAFIVFWFKIMAKTVVSAPVSSAQEGGDIANGHLSAQNPKYTA